MEVTESLIEDVPCGLRNETPETEHSSRREHLQRDIARTGTSMPGSRKGKESMQLGQGEGENDGKQRLTDHTGLAGLDKDSRFYSKCRRRPAFHSKWRGCKQECDKI